jgi:hypothetical protein
VGDAGSELPEAVQYDLRPRPPVPTFAAAAAAAVVACGLLAVYGIRGGGAVLLVAGLALLIFGITLVCGAALFMVRLRTVIKIDAKSINILRRSQVRTLQWTEIKNVSLEGERLTLHVDDSQGDVAVINPRSPADPMFSSLMATLSRRLDASRGYGGVK